MIGVLRIYLASEVPVDRMMKFAVVNHGSKTEKIISYQIYILFADQDVDGFKPVYVTAWMPNEPEPHLSDGFHLPELVGTDFVLQTTQL